MLGQGGRGGGGGVGQREAERGRAEERSLKPGKVRGQHHVSAIMTLSLHHE